MQKFNILRSLNINKAGKHSNCILAKDTSVMPRSRKFVNSTQILNQKPVLFIIVQIQEPASTTRLNQSKIVVARNSAKIGDQF